MDTVMSKKFVSEEEIQEARERRKAEWKRVLEEGGEKSNIEAAIKEEEYDPRTLYERLQEQKMKKEEMFQEMTRFSNLIHRLDEDEIDFLAALETEERNKELNKLQKEEEELKEFRRAAIEAEKKAASIISIIPTAATTTTDQQQTDAQRMILEGAVKRKNSTKTRKKSLNETDPPAPAAVDGKNPSSSPRHLDKRIKLDESSTLKTEKVKDKSVKESSSTKKIANSKSNPLASILAYSEDSEDDNSN
ncbi:3696_t:CDS:2 [Ambispora leptoticha]|uniref:3696_t:CDS:1 n=1 Tax=Ambispora leptoticha TaxID=144679 RepID=A0A9N9GI22_9GLOM|nr:3696_t:CDS:2 [Ambispora leptoticha]